MVLHCCIYVVRKWDLISNLCNDHMEKTKPVYGQIWASVSAGKDIKEKKRWRYKYKVRN